MDYISEFDIHLDKEMYYAGELLTGFVLLKTIENFKLKAIKVLLRGKAHCEWKMMIQNEKRTVKDEEIFIEDRSLIFGNESTERAAILPRGKHVFRLQFQLPESQLPCSFESKFCTIRYYVKVTLDILYSSPPQILKYFTIIGPHIDCMDQKYLKPISINKTDRICCFCTTTYITQLKTSIERSAFCAGETIRVKAFVCNKSASPVRLRLKLVQYFNCSINRGVIGLSKQSSHTVLEYRGDEIAVNKRSKFDSGNSLIIPTMPPTIDSNVCRLMSLQYLLKVWIESSDKSNEILKVNLPITIATSPFRIPNSDNQPVIEYANSCEWVEGGNYIGPEFLIGQVYDGGIDNVHEEIVLYRPLYVCVKPRTRQLKDTEAHSSHLKDLHLKESKESSHSKELKESNSKYSSINSAKEISSKEDGLNEIQPNEPSSGNVGAGKRRHKKHSLKNQHSLDNSVLIEKLDSQSQSKRSSLVQGQISLNKLRLSSLDKRAISNELNISDHHYTSLLDHNLIENESAINQSTTKVIYTQPKGSLSNYQ